MKIRCTECQGAWGISIKKPQKYKERYICPCCTEKKRKLTYCNRNSQLQNNYLY
jgi:hypothetical protein